ncbi:MAG: type II secretion system protein GspL [Pontixanthobacter sp.]
MNNSQPEMMPQERRNESGIWSLDNGNLASVEDFDEGPCVVLVHSENVLMLAVELPPIASAAKRRAALPFAIEDRVAQPLEKVHVALGAELSPNVFLVCVVRHDLMQRWIARLELADLHHASLVPDALALPRPTPGHWAVDLVGGVRDDMDDADPAGRACIRAPDGTGFAMPAAMLEQAWTAAGEPRCIAFGDPLPPHMQGAFEPAVGEPAPLGEVPGASLPPGLLLQEQSLAQRLIVPALDLRQGIYAAPRAGFDPLRKRIATILGIGLVAHAAIAGANVMALSNIADEREAEVRLLAQNMQPPFTIDADLAVTAAAITPTASSSAPGQFLPLLTRAGTALGASVGVLTWQSVGFDAATQSLTLAVEAADLEALQAASAALEAGGLVVTPGAANSAQSTTAVGTAGIFIVRAP